MIFCLRQLQEKCIEQEVWLPKTFTTMIEALHTGMMANVGVGGEVSELFSVTNGIKQGYVLAPRSSPSSYRLPRLSGWRLHTVQTEL